MNVARRLTLVVLALAFWFANPQRAVSQTQYPAYNGHVNDFANVLDAQTKDKLETILLNFEERTGAQIAVATITTLAERPIEEYANGLYRAWGIGAKAGENKNKGALLLVVTQDRRSRLEVGYGLEGDLPDGLSGEMLRRMRPFFREQQWSEGLTVGVRTIIDTLAKKWDVSIEGIDQRYAYDAPPAGSGDQSPASILPLIIFGIFLLITIVRIARRRGGGGPGGPASWLGPLIFNRGGGSFGGSSSGGSDGGGSDWGGFGGGSSGGGGASDSW